MARTEVEKSTRGEPGTRPGGKATRAPASPPDILPRIALLLASFLSGAAALNYELLWMRELTLVAGSTQAAISAVLSVYFLGLALGNALAGRFAARFSRPLLAYAAVELAIGLGAVLFLPALGKMQAVYGHLYAGLPAGSPWILLLRLSCAAALLLVPATCLGATLPLLAHFGAGGLRRASRWSGLLYGVNTLGAMVGTFATGFYLIERFGVAAPLRATGLLNLAACALVSPWVARVPLGLSAGGERRGPAPAGPPPPGRILLLGFGVLGFCNIAVEVLWTNFFSLIFPNDTYVYSTLLLAFLGGVGAGSLVGQRLFPRADRPVFALGVLQFASAAASLGMIFFVPPLAASIASRPGGFGHQLFGYFAGVGAGTLVPTVCMGASFPLLVRAALTRADQAGSLVGRALSWNTLGGVAGACVGSFVLLDRVGLLPGLITCALLTAGVGVLFCLLEPGRRRRAWIPAAGFGVPVVIGFLMVPPRLPDDLFAMHFPAFPATRILETGNSVHGTVAITEEIDGLRRVWINSTWVASEGAHLSFGYGPWLLHPGPVRSALGICCGTGRTFGALLGAGIPDLDLVDINPAVVRLSGKWLARSNHGVLHDPRAHVIIDDGRNFVRYGTKRYDLITLEPLQMFQKGVAYFYTEDFYRAARARLADGGVLCQWLPLYLLDQHQFRSVVKTFLQVFPNSLIWGRLGHSLVLLGYRSPPPAPGFDAEEIRARLAQPQVRADLAQDALMGRYDPIACALVQGDGLRALSEAGEIYTDDRPGLEFTSPRARYTPDENLALVTRHLVPLAGLFHLPPGDLAAELEALRLATLQLSFTGADRDALLQGILATRRRIYAGIDTTAIALPVPVRE